MIVFSGCRQPWQPWLFASSSSNQFQLHDVSSSPSSSSSSKQFIECSVNDSNKGGTGDSTTLQCRLFQPATNCPSLAIAPRTRSKNAGRADANKKCSSGKSCRSWLVKVAPLPRLKLPSTVKSGRFSGGSTKCL